MSRISSLSRLGRLSLGFAVAAGAVLGVTQITSGANNSTKESVFVGIVPARLLDTRQDQTTFDGFDQAVGRLDAGTTYELDIADRAGIPTDALSVTANLVAVNPSGPGYLTVYPCGFDKPLASALNYEPGVNNANEFSVPLGEYGDICIYTHAETDIVVDIYGYYIAGSGTEGPQGPAGPAGPQGPVGTGITVKGSTGEAGEPSFDGAETGDVWIDTNNEAWVWTDQDAWDDAGNIQGPAGPAGADGQDGVSPAQVVWVAQSGGDFTKLSDALASITDASATKPYVIKIAPGTYTETAHVAMKNYVDVEGSGQDITTIKCACSKGSVGSSAAVISAIGITAEIRHLTINNTGGGTNNYGIGLWAAQGSFSMLHVTATATGGGKNNYGVYYSASDSTMNNVTATATGGTQSNYGVYNERSDSTMNNVTATATGGTISTSGVYTKNLSSPTMNNMTITATGGTYNYGLHVDNESKPTIRNSSITALNPIITIAGVQVKVANTTLVGFKTGPADTYKCVGAMDADFNELSATCG